MLSRLPQILFPPVFPWQALCFYSARSSVFTSSGWPSLLPVQLLTFTSLANHPGPTKILLCSCICLVAVSLLGCELNKSRVLILVGLPVSPATRTVPGTKFTLSKYLFTKRRHVMDDLFLGKGKPCVAHLLSPLPPGPCFSPGTTCEGAIH